MALAEHFRERCCVAACGRLNVCGSDHDCASGTHHCAALLQMYNFTSFTVSLNELESGMEKTLPPTDCRLRPDIRGMENGNMGTRWAGLTVLVWVGAGSSGFIASPHRPPAVSLRAPRSTALPGRKPPSSPRHLQRCACQALGAHCDRACSCLPVQAKGSRPPHGAPVQRVPGLCCDHGASAESLPCEGAAGPLPSPSRASRCPRERCPVVRMRMLLGG